VNPLRLTDELLRMGTPSPYRDALQTMGWVKCPECRCEWRPRFSGPEAYPEWRVGLEVHRDRHYRLCLPCPRCHRVGAVVLHSQGSRRPDPDPDATAVTTFLEVLLTIFPWTYHPVGLWEKNEAGLDELDMVNLRSYPRGVSQW
jgi:hypothetical protein